MRELLSVLDLVKVLVLVAVKPAEFASALGLGVAWVAMVDHAEARRLGVWCRGNLGVHE